MLEILVKFEHLQAPINQLAHNQKDILANVQGMQTDFIEKLADALWERQEQGQQELPGDRAR